MSLDDDRLPGKAADGSQASLALRPSDRFAARFLVIVFVAVVLISVGMLVQGVLTAQFDLVSLASILVLTGILGTIHIRRRRRQGIRMMGPVTWGEHVLLQVVGLLIDAALLPEP